MLAWANIQHGADRALRRRRRVGDRLGCSYLEGKFSHPLVHLIGGQGGIAVRVAYFDHEIAHILFASINGRTNQCDASATLTFRHDRDAAEVDESDRAVRAEAEIRRVWVGVEQVRMPPGAGREPRDYLRPGVLQILVGPLCGGPIHSIEIGHGQHPITGRLTDDLRYPNERVIAVEFAERDDVGRLMAVVGLLRDARRQLLYGPPHVGL